MYTLEVKPLAAEENLQFWGQNIAVFVYFLIDFWLLNFAVPEVSDELNDINILTLYDMFS